MRWSRLGSIAVLAVLVLAACAPAGQQASLRPQAEGETAAATGPAPTLVLLTRTEPSILNRKMFANGSEAHPNGVQDIFHAGFFRFDEHRTPLPYLVEALPKLDTDTWRVFPDGRMETTYKLKPDLTWHDGTPFAAEDYVFSLQVYRPAQLGFRTMPQNLIEEIVAPDSRTVVIRWKQPYPEADAISQSELPPLPRHLLEASFNRDAPDTFMSQPFWTREFVGLGPYRLDRWEPGAYIDAVAFDGHVLGRPKFERMHIIWSSDPNTAVATLLSGAAHVAIDASIAFQQGLVLKREWTPRNGGSVLMTAAEVRFIHVQHRPEMANPTSIRDPRVRKALAHLTDRQALLDGLLDGEGRVADTLLPPEIYTPEVDRAITKYPLDPSRAAQLLAEAGLTRGADSFYAGPEGRFRPEVRTIAGGQIEREMTILADTYRRNGVDAPEFVLPAAQSSDGQALASFPALFTGKSNTDDSDGGLDKLLSDKVPRAETRWSGSALGGYSSPEFDRLYNVFSTALDRSTRQQAVVDMSRLVSEEMSAIPLYYNFVVNAHVAALQGPREAVSTYGWVHEWQWK